TRLQLPIYALAARAAVGEPRAPVRAAYWFVSDRGKYEQRGYALTPEIEERFDTVLRTMLDGIEAGVFCAHPDPPRSYVHFVSCRYCDPDGLGTRDRWAEWERKKHAPELAGYLALVEPEAVSGHD
ncbi:MAG: PD-(D/E)XK nuclease family protein, partial [Acidimicrobiia bacterium]|nr:PD-(D/E)XK nuclease family protein [Acidimicrobiia bacterium]